MHDANREWQLNVPQYHSLVSVDKHYFSSAEANV